jgi:hypothetical protein
MEEKFLIRSHQFGSGFIVESEFSQVGIMSSEQTGTNSSSRRRLTGEIVNVVAVTRSRQI